MEYANSALAAMNDLETRLEWLYQGKFNYLKSNVIFESISPFSVTDSSTMGDELNAFHAWGVQMIKPQNDYLCGTEADFFIVEEGWSEFHSGIVYLISANHEGNRVQIMLGMEL